MEKLTLCWDAMTQKIVGMESSDEWWNPLAVRAQ